MPKAVVVGSGAGGAAAALELQGSFDVTVVEAGGTFRPLPLSVPLLEAARGARIMFDERQISWSFPAMRVHKSREGLVLVHGRAVGGTTPLATANALRLDEPLRRLGIDLDAEFAELAGEIPMHADHRRSWRPDTERLFRTCAQMGLEPQAMPKMIDLKRCRRCGRCVLGCPTGAKWDSRRFVQRAEQQGAALLSGWQAQRVLLRGGRAVGVEARRGPRRLRLEADLVVLAAGGFGTPRILAASGLRCRERLFVDPVLCVAAPLRGAQQHRELPMPFYVERPGYIVSPYFDYVSFLFNRAWRRPAGDILTLMIKLADTPEGSAAARPVAKGLSEADRARLGEAEALCREILSRSGADVEQVMTGTVNGGHPGGALALSAAEAQGLHPAGLPENLYAADATLLPDSLGAPPSLTIMALARRVARVCAREFGLGRPSRAARCA